MPLRLILLLFFIPCWCFGQHRYDVVIDEIMADPAPAVGLPGNEWIELTNRAALPIDLAGWRLNDAASESGPFPHYVLPPDSFVIVCPSNAIAAMQSFGASISVNSFPSLDNAGDLIFLTAADSTVIDAVEYSDRWYGNELKKGGGWTLEMIDTKDPCSTSNNWKASVDPSGGTPARKNSVDGTLTGQLLPELKYAYTIDSTTLIAVYSQPVDSLSATDAANYSLDGLPVSAAVAVAPLFNAVRLKLTSSMMPNRVYTLLANNIENCNGKNAGMGSARAGLPATPFPGDVVINEILFNPRPNGYDYAEYYNNSNKIVDASKLFAANRNSAGTISSIEKIFSTPFYLFPGDYLVITEDLSSLQMNYLVKNPDAIEEVGSMPSYPDDEGDVILLNEQGEVVDEVKYSKSWQFKLIDNQQGVSLERIDPGGPSQNPSNWHSAASTAGYGSPGYRNSEFRLLKPQNAMINVTPKTFSPDNDGRDDIATVLYKVSEPGYVANVTIFDSQGRPARNLVRNGILGLSGYWNWDGLDDKGNPLAIGIYIVFTEIFNLQGNRMSFKNSIVLARKLN